MLLFGYGFKLQLGSVAELHETHAFRLHSPPIILNVVQVSSSSHNCLHCSRVLPSVRGEMAGQSCNCRSPFFIFV